MVLGLAVCIEHEALKDFAKANNLYDQVGFLKHFPKHCRLKTLTGLNCAAGQTPPTLQRLVSTLHQQHTVAVKYQCTDTQDRLGRITPDIRLLIYSPKAPLTFILAR